MASEEAKCRTGAKRHDETNAGVAHGDGEAIKRLAPYVAAQGVGAKEMQHRWRHQRGTCVERAWFERRDETAGNAKKGENGKANETKNPSGLTPGKFLRNGERGFDHRHEGASLPIRAC